MADETHGGGKQVRRGHERVEVGVEQVDEERRKVKEGREDRR